MQLCTFLELGFANFHVIFHMHHSKLIVPTRNASTKLEKKGKYKKKHSMVKIMTKQGN